MNKVGHSLLALAMLTGSPSATALGLGRAQAGSKSAQDA
jgi:hypothetical protein